MSEEQLKAFLEKVKGDSSLQEKLKAAADADAVAAIAKEAGFAITAEDIQSMQSSTDLSDDELEVVAGGTDVIKLLLNTGKYLIGAKPTGICCSL